MFPFKVEISLLLLLTTASVDPNPVPRLFEDVDFLEEAGNLSRDLNSIYTGWVNSSFIYPYYLKVTVPVFGDCEENIINYCCVLFPGLHHSQ